MRTVATAGHVDHGKSSLVLALSGTDPDRFPEEKTRGLTIDLGFAFTTLPSGERVGFVDVPGHIRFLKNMLAGVGAVDVAIFVVAADEGWMPQSEEHAQILDLLGIHNVVTVLSKADLVDADALELARLELDEHLADHGFPDSAVVVTDSRSGRGLDDLRGALDALLASTPPTPDRDRPRLWIDRVFAARGTGTVVTGTLAGGPFAVDDEVVIVPGGHRARVRRIEADHEQLARTAPGTRVALNLAGIEHRDLVRGHAVVRPTQWAAETEIEVALQPIPGGTLRRRGMLHAHIGSGEHEVRFRALDADARFARLRLPAPLPLAPGDRLVLRDPGPDRTVAGAEVLDVSPRGPARTAARRLTLPLAARLLAARRWLPIVDLPRLTGLSIGDALELADEAGARRVGDWLVTADDLDTLGAAATAAVLAHRRENPLDASLELATLAARLGVASEQLRAAIDQLRDLETDRGRVRHRSDHARAADTTAAHALLDAFAAAPFAPPEPSSIGADPALVRALVREGHLVQIGDILLTSDALSRARALVTAAVRERGGITVADVRDLLGSTRKYVVPILEQLDREGVTRRRGDERTLGPAAG